MAEKRRRGGRLSSRHFIACFARTVLIVIENSMYAETLHLSGMEGVQEPS